MRKIVFWYKTVGILTLFIGFLFAITSFVQAQTQADIRIEIDKNRVNPGEPVNVTLSNLKIGSTYTLAVASTDGKVPYHTFPITVQKDSGTCVIPKAAGTFEEGDQGWCDLSSDMTYFVKLNTTGYNCRQNGGDGRCQIRLVVSGKDVAPPQYLTVNSGSSSKENTGSPNNVELKVLPEKVLLGEQVNVILSRIPLLGDCGGAGNPCTYNFQISNKDASAAPYATLDLAVQRTNDGYNCKATTQGKYPAWVGQFGSYIPCTLGIDGLLTYATKIDTGELGFTPTTPSFTYSVSVLFNGKDIKSTIYTGGKVIKPFTVNNEFHLEFSATPMRGKQTEKNVISLDEKVQLTSKAVGCFQGNVIFQYWGEPAGQVCASGGTCGYDPITKDITVDEDSVSAIDTNELSLQDFGTSGALGKNLDADGDGVATIGVRATCPAQNNKTTTGTVTLYKEGLITLSIDKTIKGYYDKGVKGLERIPILDRSQPITYSVYGLRNGDSSVGAGIDRTNCFYIELFRRGVRLKRPPNYPAADLGDANCQQKSSGLGGVLPEATIVIDRPGYVFHIFNGEDDVYTDLVLCEGSICAPKSSGPRPTDSNGKEIPPGVLTDGEYELRLYEANGLENNLNCAVTPDAPTCNNIEDSLVASTTFQVGSAYHEGTAPPCRKGLVQFLAASRGKMTQAEVEFNSPEEFDEYFRVHPDRIMLRCLEVNTALGGFATDPSGFVSRLLGFLLSISGGVALILIIRAGYQVMASRGDPEKLGEARERLTAAIVGLLFIIFSLVILEVIGVDILRIPGFCRSGDADCVQQGSANDPSVSPTPELP